MKLKLKNLIAIIVMAISAALSIDAQNLTASQLNIYFGHPKKAITYNNGEATITSFDTQGRITSVSHGNMRMAYDWAQDGKSVAVSVYNGKNLQSGGVINIETMSPSLLKYNVEGTDMTVAFKKNGAIEKMSMSNPYMTGTQTYYYHNKSDAYPYAIELTTGNQSAKMEVTVNRKDAYGNAVEITQEMMGQKISMTQTIEYY